MLILLLHPAYVAVRSVLDFGVQRSRVIGIKTRFPDIGKPVPVEVGFLRYLGEPAVGDAESVAPGSTSNHNV